MDQLMFKICETSSFGETERSTLTQMLREQGKVQGPYENKIDRCRLLCVATLDGQLVGIGAVKQKTASDFDADKANLPELADEFQWELGYLYTRPQYEGQGVASKVVQLLLNAYGDSPIMASTEISANPGMVKILERSGFRLFGKAWKSAIHGKCLGLFLRPK